MSNLTDDSVHFVPWDRIPILPASATVKDALQQLGSRRVGGLIVTGGRVDSFIKGAALAQAVLAATQSVPVATSGGAPFAAADPWDAVLTKEIGQFLDNVKAQMDLQREPGVVPIASAKLTDGLQKYANEAGHRAIAILDDAGRKLGLYFNHEHFAEVFRADPPIWLCERVPEPHENTDPDNGKCSFCYRKLVKLK